VILPPGSATASIRGHRVVVPLDFCTYCGKGPKALAALRSIMRSG
jgi:hypothetical protein